MFLCIELKPLELKPLAPFLPYARTLEPSFNPLALITKRRSQKSKLQFYFEVFIAKICAVIHRKITIAENTMGRLKDHHKIVILRCDKPLPYIMPRSYVPPCAQRPRNRSAIAYRNIAFSLRRIIRHRIFNSCDLRSVPPGPPYDTPTIHINKSFFPL